MCNIVCTHLFVKPVKIVSDGVDVDVAVVCYFVVGEPMGFVFEVFPWVNNVLSGSH